MRSELTVDTEDELRTHVFLSFAHEDKDVAKRIARALTYRGLSVWADFTGIQPGSPDWEHDIRNGLAGAVAVVLVASPDSRVSQYVRAELALARARGLTIYPLWIKGDEWTDCIALDLVHTQYIDVRDDLGLKRLDPLAMAIQPHIERRLPNHIVIRRAVTHVTKTDWTTVTAARVPPGYVGVIVDDTRALQPSDVVDRSKATAGPAVEGTWSGRGALFKLSQYRVVGHFLNDLFTRFLAARFEPFTYGSAWILLRSAGFRASVALCPWAWLDQNHSVHDDVFRRWAATTPVASCGLASVEWWVIGQAAPEDYFGIASPNPEFLSLFQERPKFGMMAIGGMARPTDVHADSDPRVTRLVISNDALFGRPEESSKPRAYEHYPQNDDEEMFKFWRE
jgi:hypothetical protein